MNDQLKIFLSGLLYMLVDYRMQSSELRGNYHDWAKWGRIGGRIQLACDLGLITLDQQHAFQHLLVSASDHMGKPFPHKGNAGPVMPGAIALDRLKAVAVEAKPPVQATESVVVEVESKPKEGWGKPYLARKAHYFINGQSICNRWLYTGAVVNRLLAPYLGCSACKRLLAVKPQAQDSANEKPEPVPAPTSRRELRLLCVLGKPHLGTAETSYLPIHTMHRVPPRAMVKGKWSQPRYAGLYLRETQAVVPSATVLARCERHRQTHAFRAPARTVRTGGVIA